ncbi:hypothetical protein [Halohasta litchfieldiae]|uniref:hypothetical protein n=1 Tax=Halohasta litchfieldiae TaxID=1073996 RepID=UPI00115FF6B0|nr:hypothetical protein [Halohasta litchfieldiae]
MLRQTGAMIAGGSVLTLAGCTESTASDETQQRTEVRSFERDEESIDEPAPAGQSSLSGTSVPNEPPDWIETNMTYQGWYDTTLYNESIGWDFDSDYFYVRNRGLFNIRATTPDDVTNTHVYATSIEYSNYLEGELHIEAVGSNAFLTVSLPDANGYEIWISGTLQIEKYWIGLF